MWFTGKHHWSSKQDCFTSVVPELPRPCGLESYEVSMSRNQQLFQWDKKLCLSFDFTRGGAGGEREGGGTKCLSQKAFPSGPNRILQ